MKIDDISKYYKIFNNDGIVLSYQGPFVQEMIEEISAIMNKKLSSYSELKMNSKFLSLFIEQAQNILHYSSNSFKDKDGVHISHGFIITGIKNSNIFIISGNPIDKKHEAILRDKLNNIKDCSRKELNKLFKEQLKNDNENNLSRGASLGLIDISRKSDNMEYHFDTMDSGETFFSIKTEYYNHINKDKKKTN